jgi:UDP-N-acetylenolpyruvoylglucosamine reductase
MIKRKELHEMLENSRLERVYGGRMCESSADGNSRNCDVLVKTGNIDALLLALRLSKLAEIPFTVIGSGSTIPVSDSPGRGMLVKLSGEFCALRFQDGQRLIAGAGVSLAKFVAGLQECGAPTHLFSEFSTGTVGSWFHHLLKAGELSRFPFIQKVVFLDMETLALQEVKPSQDLFSESFLDRYVNQIVLSLQVQRERKQVVCGFCKPEEMLEDAGRSMTEKGSPVGEARP